MRNKTSNRLKTVLLIIISIIMTLFLQSCNVQPETQYLFEPIIQRVEQNKELAKQLNDNGLISDVEYNVINSHLETKREDLLNLSKTLKDNASKNLSSLQDDVTLKAILASSQSFWDSQFDDVSDVYKNQDSFENSDIVALLKHYQSTIDLYSNLNQDGQSVQPLEILDDSIKSEIRNQDKGKVYVIDMSKVQGLGGQTNNSADALAMYINQINEAVEGLKTSSNGTVTRQDGTTASYTEIKNTLDKIFSPLLDEEGNQVSWIDIQSLDTIQISQPVQQQPGAVNLQGASTATGGLTLRSDYQDVPGNDIVISNKIKDKDGNTNVVNLLTIRTEELNEEVVKEMINSVNGSTSSRMMLIDGNFYITTYPVATIGNIMDQGNNFKIDYQIQDQMLLDLRTGNILKVNGSKEIVTNSNDGYITLGNGSLEDYSSFILSDSSLTGSLNLGGSQGTPEQVKNNIPVFILRDYMEAVYTPGVVNEGSVDEPIVIYGRLIRLKLSSTSGSTYNKDDPVGYYISRDHVKLTSTGFGELRVQSLADAQTLLKSENRKIKRIASVNEQYKPGIPDDVEDSENPNKTAGDSGATLVDNLPKEIVQQINPILTFPGDLDAWDRDDSSKPIMFCLTLNSSIVENGLYAHWFKSQDEINSLGAFQVWLNQRGYNYKLTENLVYKWLTVNYNIDVTRDVAIIDVDKVQKTNQILSNKKTDRSMNLFRSALLLIGALIMTWEVVAVIAWTFDTNIGMDLNILEKVSFGSMTAIKYKDEVSDIYGRSAEAAKPVTFSDLIKKVIALSAISLCLLTVDIPTIMQKAINMSSGFIAPFSDTLTGKHSEDSLHVEDYDVKTSIDTSGNGTWAEKQKEDQKDEDIEKDWNTSNTGNLKNNSNNKNSQVYENNTTSNETGSGTRGPDETNKTNTTTEKKGVLNTIKNGASNIWNGIKNGASNIASGAKDLISNLNPFKKK